MENKNLDQPVSQTPVAAKKNILPVVLGILAFLLVVGAGTFFLVKNTIQKENKPAGIDTNLNAQNASESNPKIEVLTTLPPEDPKIQYDILFDPYSRTAIYGINKDQDTASSSSTVVNGSKTDKTYSGITGLTVSLDGKRVAYIAKQNDKEFVVVDGVEGKKYDYVKNLRFSPDSKHVAYAAGEEKYFQPDSQFSGNEMTKTMFVVVDATEGKKYDGTGVGVNVLQTYDPFFSKDGTKVTYGAMINGKNIIVMDDKEFSEYANQQYSQFIGNTYDLVYVASENDKYFLVVAGQKKSSQDSISDITGWPYYIGKDATQIAYDTGSVVVNDSSYPISSGVLQDLAFNNSGKYVAYYTGTWMSKDLFVNGKKVGTVQPDRDTTVNTPLFSPDERFLAYSKYNQKEQNAAIHILSPDSLQKIVDLPLPGFKTVGKMKFSDDGKSLYFKGWQGRNIVFVTVDIDQLIKGKAN